jgi:uncharacterized Tic20 family protein
MAEESSSMRSEAAPAFSDYRPDGVEAATQTETCQEARNMAMLCHLLGIFGFFGPLLIWLIERDKHRFVDDHGRAAMNYQVSLMIYMAALAVTVVGFFLMPLLLIGHFALSILGAIRASRGESWRYPVAIPFLK